MEVSIITALLGGFLALISPCGALLLPAFFASNATRQTSLVLHGVVFYLGLALTLVPLGLGVGALGALVTEHRNVLIIGTSILLILFGVLQIFGIGFDISKYLPGAQKLQQTTHTKSGFLRTILLGATSGIAGFCAGPILGAILTLAVAQGSALKAGGLLAVYGLGMVIPLVVLAAVWHKLSPSAVKKLRGKAFTIFGKTFHTTSVLTGSIIVAVGILFWKTNGLVTLPSLIPTSVLREIQSYTGVLAHPVWDIVVLLAILGIGIFFWVRYRHNTKQQTQHTVRAEHDKQ